MKFDLTTIIPVAPRDIGFLPKCIGHLESSLYELEDSKRMMDHFDGWLLKIVVDGPVRATEMEPVYTALRAIAPEMLFAWQVHGLERPYGAGIARNYALAACTRELEAPNCELVTFMDADDIAMPWWMRTLVMPCVRHVLGEEMGLPFTYATALSEQKTPDNRTVRWSFLPVPPDQIRPALQKNNVMLTTAVCTLPQILQRAGGFEPHLICGEDGNLWRRASSLVLDDLENKNEAVTTFYGVDLPVTFYRPRPDGQSRGLHQFSPEAFHLDKNIYGLMGQNLDGKATERVSLFLAASTLEERIHALCGEVKGSLWKAS